MIGVDEARLNELFAAVGNAGFWPRHSPLVIQIDEQKLVQLKFTPAERTMPFQVDLLFARSEYQKTALARRTDEEIPGLDHPVQAMEFSRIPLRVCRRSEFSRIPLLTRCRRSLI